MTHPGLPVAWAWTCIASIVLIIIWASFSRITTGFSTKTLQVKNIPLIGRYIHNTTISFKVLYTIKLIVLFLFILVILAGLFGTPIPERNIATVLTWNIWWAALIFAILLFGTAWCAICPWDYIAQILVKRNFLRNVAKTGTSLELRVPKRIRNIWIAVWLFIGFTWLELGVGVTSSPHNTAMLALLMVVLATISLAIFERRAFCRYFCPVGRTVGCYSQLATSELRPIDSDVCQNCKTLDCYYGNNEVESCPTHLVMGRLTQNSYCTSCGNCVISCPHKNVAWRLRSPSVEAIETGRPHYDEAWFILILLALTGYHASTMLPGWDSVIHQIAELISDSGRFLWSFTVGMAGNIIIIAAFYAFIIEIARRLFARKHEYKRLFSKMAFIALPLALTFHLAHNLSHLMREGGTIGQVITNPYGSNTMPLSMHEKHEQMRMLIPQELLHFTQTALLIFGFWVAIQVIRYRGKDLLIDTGFARWRLFPFVFFATAITGLHLWLLIQPMSMRM